MSHVNRRSFLKKSAVAGAAGLGLPAIIPRSALASKTTPGANDRVGVGYIGVGRRGNQLLGLPKDAQVVAAADCYLPRAREFGKKHNCPAYQDYRELLDNADVDAVVVATPDHWHILPSVHACMADKDVYVEKPISLTIREGRQLVQAARHHRRVVQTGSQQRSMPANELGCRLVREGVIGRVTQVLAANYPSPWNCALPTESVPAGLDWEMWCGQTPVVGYHKNIFRPRAQPGWISFRPWSGGEVTGWGAHGLDQVQWALGKDDTGPVEIWTEGSKFAPPTFTDSGTRQQGESVCNEPIVMMKYADGTTMRLQGGPLGGAVFVGERGKITIDRNRLKVEPESLLLEGKFEKQSLPDHLTNWINCIKSRETPAADVEIGHRSTTVCHLANIARWTGRKLTWDPKKEQFVGDDEANGLVAREQRAPYAIPDVG
jgi:predicted dehydrogenase